MNWQELNDASRTEVAGQATSLDFGPFQLNLDGRAVEEQLAFVRFSMADDSEIMHEIADYLVAAIRDHFGRSFTPVKPETINRRRWPFHPANGIGSRAASSSTAPLVASGGTRDRIVPRSRVGYAAAKRGTRDWYLFLHEKGRGRVDQRSVMDLDPDEEEYVLRRYDDWLGTVIEKDES